MENLSERFREAVQAFWIGREDALQKQIEAGKVDAGTRGAVTSGGHMSAIEALVVELLEEAGLDRLDVKTKVSLELPGYYRPGKRWDLLVVSGSQLVTAIEFKSQAGSFGNNFNNRVEEAIGNATDIWTAFREGRLGTSRPFLGYFFLLEDNPQVHAPKINKEPYFKIDPIFRGASYAQRYSILCQRLVLERLYDGTCLTLATKSTNTEITFPLAEASFERFAAQLQGHAAGLARGLTA
ncbi:MAG: PaeR7I family type II restriction endonuclease [Thermomicrobiales bacterium]